MGSLVCAVVLGLAAGPLPRHFDVAASFAAPQEPGGRAAVSVLFSIAFVEGMGAT